MTKLKYLHYLSPELDTTKMFVISVLLSCVMRCLSFIAIGSLSLQSIRFDQNGASGPPSSSSQDPDTDFYEKVKQIPPAPESDRRCPGRLGAGGDCLGSAVAVVVGMCRPCWCCLTCLIS